MIAGALRLPGLRLPVFKQFLSNNDQQITQTDIVMLLTPHIVRTHELTADDLSPIYIGTQQNLGLGGPPPLIAPAPDEPVPSVGKGRRRSFRRALGFRPAACRARRWHPISVRSRSTARRRPAHRRCRADCPSAGGRPPPAGAAPTVPPGGSAAAAGRVPPAGAPVGTVPPAPARGDPAQRCLKRRATSRRHRPVQRVPHATPSQVILTVPGTTFQVGGRTVPVSINNASRVSVMTLTITFNPKVLRVRNVQDGTFMRQAASPRRSRRRSMRSAAASTSPSPERAIRSALRARVSWRRCCSTPSAGQRDRDRQRSREHPEGTPVHQSGHGDRAVGTGDVRRHSIGQRLHLHRAAGRHGHPARARVGGDAARPRLGAAPERGGAAPLPA